jgi:hypothetical protein
MYRRVRRNIGRQPVNTRRLQLRIGIFVMIGAPVLFFSLSDMTLLGALLGGFAGGAALAYLGLEHYKDCPAEATTISQISSRDSDCGTTTGLCLSELVARALMNVARSVLIR